MSTATKPRTSVERVAKPIGADGKTLGQRLQEAMRDHRPPMSESDLVLACKDFKDAEARPLVSQQLVNQILKGRNSRSAITPLLAEALGVRAVWLQFGFAPSRTAGPAGRREMSHRDRADKAFMEAFRELPKEWEFTIRTIVSTLAVAMRESHGEFAKKARAHTLEMMGLASSRNDE